jgi:hypothetical protein
VTWNQEGGVLPAMETFVACYPQETTADGIDPADPRFCVNLCDC